MALRVLGVDPGSAATGWALVRSSGSRLHLESSGVIRPKGGDRAGRLAQLMAGFAAVLEETRPDVAAVESPFAGRNPRSGLVLAESRGVLLALLGEREVAVTSYTPAEVKSAVVGHGRAEKQQIVFMVVRLLGLDREPARDAADAMAVALTHHQLARWKRRTVASEAPPRT